MKPKKDVQQNLLDGILKRVMWGTVTNPLEIFNKCLDRLIHKLEGSNKKWWINKAKYVLTNSYGYSEKNADDYAYALLEEYFEDNYEPEEAIAEDLSCG